MSKTLILICIVFIIAWTIFAPFAAIWALNTLFNLAIPYSLKNWFAINIIGSVFASYHYSSSLRKG